MFRRKADSLPTFVSHTYDQPADDKKLQGVQSRFQFTSPKLSHIISILLFGGFCFLVQQVYSSDFSFESVEFGSFLSADFDAAEENETTMEEIMKRHPYVTIPHGGNEDLKYDSTILKTHTRPKTEEDTYGNIIFFSFHGRVGSVSLLNALHNQYGYQDGGHLHLGDINNHTRSNGGEEWGRHDASENSVEWQSNIIDRIENTFSGYGKYDTFTDHTSVVGHTLWCCAVLLLCSFIVVQSY